MLKLAAALAAVLLGVCYLVLDRYYAQQLAAQVDSLVLMTAANQALWGFMPNYLNLTIQTNFTFADCGKDGCVGGQAELCY
jgi:hypothetical protein